MRSVSRFLVAAVTALLVTAQQHPFFAPLSLRQNSAEHFASLRAAGDGTAGRYPNVNTRYEETASGPLFCGKSGDTFKSGFAHFTNVDGDEDKHMFWWLFNAREYAENKPVVLVFGGGPGTTGMTSTFLGEGPCLVEVGENGTSIIQTAPYSWIDEVNLLAIDHPVGVGFSHGKYESLRRTAEEAAWDIDDFLQVFWKNHPKLAKNQFLVHSGSYGGTYIPNLISVIHNRNLAPSSSRLLKRPDVMMSNVWSDPLTHYRHYVLSLCDDLGFFNASGCAEVVRGQPACLDAVQLAYEQPTVGNRVSALWTCQDGMAHEELVAGRDMTDNRCPAGEDCFVARIAALESVLNSTSAKRAIGVPEGYNFSVNAGYEVVHPLFMSVGDLIQPAYKLLGPAIEDGLRVLVYNGDNDGVCPRRSNLAWMNLFETKYQAEFRAAPEVEWPGVGWFKQAGAANGTRAGNYTFVSVLEAGHGPFKDQPKAAREILVKWLKNEPFLG